MKFNMLINIKITTVGILIFTSTIDFMESSAYVEKKIKRFFVMYQWDKFHAENEIHMYM